MPIRLTDTQFAKRTRIDSSPYILGPVRLATLLTPILAPQKSLLNSRDHFAADAWSQDLENLLGSDAPSSEELLPSMEGGGSGGN